MTEVLTIDLASIVPIFQLPIWVIGVCNWRGEILWLVDFGYLIGSSTWHQQGKNASNQTVIILQKNSPKAIKSSNNKRLGIIVNRVENIEWCNYDLMQSPSLSSVTPELVPFLRGYYLKANSDILAFIDTKAIIAKLKKLQQQDFSLF